VNDLNKSELVGLGAAVSSLYRVVLAVPYAVTVKTGDKSSSGTDARVFITINGDKNKSSRAQLQKSESKKDPFESGNTDIFKLNDVDIGDVSIDQSQHRTF
jgi:hypothetical protein